MKRLILFLFLFIVMISIVNAVQPTVYVPVFKGSIDILTAIDNYHGLNQDHNYRFHVFNSTGHLLENDIASCYLHAYDPDEDYLFEGEIHDGGEDFNITLSGGNFTKIGIYPYNIWCNSTQGEGGSLEGNIVINRFGYDYSSNIFNQETSLSISIIIFFLTLTILIFVYPRFIKLEDFSSPAKEYLKQILNWSSTLLSLGMLLMTTTVMYTLSKNAFLMLDKEFSFLIIIGSRLIYLVAFISTVTFLFRLVTIKKDSNIRKRNRMDEE